MPRGRKAWERNAVLVADPSLPVANRKLLESNTTAAENRLALHQESADSITSRGKDAPKPSVRVTGSTDERWPKIPSRRTDIRCDRHIARIDMVISTGVPSTVEFEASDRLQLLHRPLAGVPSVLWWWWLRQNNWSKATGKGARRATRSR